MRNSVARFASGHDTPFGVRDLDTNLADPLVWLLDLLDRRQNIPVLAPLIRREIVWRLLEGVVRDPYAPAGASGGHIARICRATYWIAELPERVNMSVPSFHRDVKKITTVSPLQLQKRVRLYLVPGRLLASEPVGTVA